MQEKLTREKIQLDKGIYVYTDELDRFFGLYTVLNDKEVDLMDPKTPTDTFDPVYVDLIKRAREIPRDRYYRKNMHFLFSAIPMPEIKQPKPKTDDAYPKEQDKNITEPNQYQLFDQMDEEQIKDEIEGRVIEDYFYDLQFGERHVTGISYNGVKAAIRWMAEKENAGIEITRIEETETPDRYRFTAWARNTKLNVLLPGMASQPKKMEVWNKQKTQKIVVDDPFAENKAFAKAIRNALRSQLPEPLILQMLNIYREKIKHVEVK